jgi:hypothetical protein
MQIDNATATHIHVINPCVSVEIRIQHSVYILMDFAFTNLLLKSISVNFESIGVRYSLTILLIQGLQKHSLSS